MWLLRKMVIVLGCVMSLNVLLGAHVSAADQPSGRKCAMPVDGIYATFQVADAEVFHVLITNPKGIDQAMALWRSNSKASIPYGLLVCEFADWNCNWSWHLDPETVAFAELALGDCDARPSVIECDCEAFGSYYCPWSARLIELRDCRAAVGCPSIPR